jgi:3',5'-cyclic-AMP phosphodiesterase
MAEYRRRYASLERPGVRRRRSGDEGTEAEGVCHTRRARCCRRGQWQGVSRPLWQGHQRKGWYSFDQGGAHFIALINVFNFEPGFKSAGLAKLGNEQLEWMERDVKGLSASTPIVGLAHLPLWTVYEEWGWGTEDAPRALGYLKRFGSVTVLNGHIHQIQQKVEGNVSLHTARPTAFPQPAPGSAPAPGPMKVPAEELHSVLGVRTVNYVPGKSQLALVETPLA